MRPPLYTVTLNFFVPEEVAQTLSEIQLSGPVIFDWRKKNLTHCTVKAIYHGPALPEDPRIESWIREAGKILSSQSPFEVVLKDFAQWPTAWVVKVQSDELNLLHKRLSKVLPGIRQDFSDHHYHPMFPSRGSGGK